MATIKLPVTEKMTLDSNEDQWRLLSSGLIDELSTSALIEVEPGRKIKIKIILQRVLSPEHIESTGDVMCYKGDFGEDVDNGLVRTKKFLNDFFEYFGVALVVV